ncbi:unnamed protein product [Trifolium pratense]|uniref:Uncharacterized protein n=1 Tax=Trifolium pratense TaxID=57577 RepID=A0ACB0LGU4_TRIPR|nr:unnamed protein product [Trifolium pratense]
MLNYQIPGEWNSLALWRLIWPLIQVLSEGIIESNTSIPSQQDTPFNGEKLRSTEEQISNIVETKSTSNDLCY